MQSSTRQQIETLVHYLETNRSRVVIDADTHATDLDRMTGDLLRRRETSPNYYQGRPLSAEELLSEMKTAGVDMALTWQNPAATAYTADPEHNYRSLLAANRYIYDSGRRHPGHFIPAGWIDPQALGAKLALELVDTLVEEFGFLFIKMNPAQNGYSIDGEAVRRMVDRIVEHGAIPAFHFGGDTSFTPADGLERIARMHPRHPVLAVHMGGGGGGYIESEELYHDARELGLRQPNIRYVLSAKRDTHIESDLITYQLAGEPFCRNLFCASDAPYGRMAWNFGGYRAMFSALMEAQHHTDARVRAQPGLFTPEVAQNYLGGNFAAFAIAGYRHLLDVQRSRVENHQPVNQTR